MISISDDTRNVKINEQAGFAVVKESRGTLYRTLDGGAFIYDAGVQAGGLDFKFTAFMTKENADILKAIHTESEPIYISTKDGAFKGKIKRIKDIKGKMDITIWTSEAG